MEYTKETIPNLISRVHALTADFTNIRLPKGSKLVSSHGFILYILSKEDSLSKKDIADRINRDKSTTTVLIRKLLKEGLVSERVHDKDTRVKLISLTEKGKKMNKLTAEISGQLLEASFNGFTEKEKDTLLSLLLKMNKNMEESLQQ